MDEKLRQQGNVGLERRRSDDSSQISVNNSFDEEFRVKVFEIVRRTIILSNRTPLNDELAEAQEVWEDALRGIIPSADLVTAFKRAVADRQNGFAPTAFDLIVAYKAIQAERVEEAEKERAKLCPRYGHDPRTGTMEIVDPFDFDKEVTLPCAYCRATEYAVARQELVSSRLLPSPLELVERYAERQKDSPAKILPFKTLD